jgi:branched-chain amino acid aminotransferase
MALAHARQIPVIERFIEPTELETFEECFLTGSAAEVTPVSEIGPHKFAPGKLSETMMNAYAADVRKPVSEVTLTKVA